MSLHPRADQSTVRRRNSRLVLGTIAAAPDTSRADVAARTGLAKATVSALVDCLVEADLVNETGLQARTGRGRPGTALSPSPTGPHGLGVEIAVDYVAVCLLDLTGQVRRCRFVPGDSRGRTPAQVFSRVARVVRSELDHAASLHVPIGGLGVALPGLVEKDNGMLRAAPNLGWRDVDPASALRDRLPLDGLPVLVDNEADMGARAELWSGAHGELSDFLYVSGEAGVGSGITIDGRLFRGVRGFGGEIGHLCVAPEGPRCHCGARGCLEAVAGTEAILTAAGLSENRPPGRGEASVPTEAAYELLLRRLEDGDARAIDAVSAAGRSLGVALSGAINTLDLPTVVLGSRYAALERSLRPSLEAELAERVPSSRWEPVQVLRAHCGQEAAALGAARTVTEAVLSDPELHMIAR